MKNLNYSSIKNVYDKKNYVFKGGVYEMNIFGIRGASDIVNKFNDWIGVAYISEIGVKVAEIWTATTDPGLYYLAHPMNDKGCAALVPGQYHNSHKIGMHRGDHMALVQTGRVSVFRDDNKDGVIDFEPDSIESGCGFGINIHRADRFGVADLVNKYSAGCQVFKNPSDLDYLLTLCKKQEAHTDSGLFTYTLFTEADFK